jgi:hypothetical protein
LYTVQARGGLVHTDIEWIFFSLEKSENPRKYVISRAPDRKITNNFAVSQSQLIILGEWAKENGSCMNQKNPPTVLWWDQLEEKNIVLYISKLGEK